MKPTRQNTANATAFTGHASNVSFQNTWQMVWTFAWKTTHWRVRPTGNSSKINWKLSWAQYEITRKCFANLFSGFATTRCFALQSVNVSKDIFISTTRGL